MGLPLVFLWLWLLEYEDFSILMRGVIVVGTRVWGFLDFHERSCRWYKGCMGISWFSWEELLLVEESWRPMYVFQRMGWLAFVCLAKRYGDALVWLHCNPHTACCTSNNDDGAPKLISNQLRNKLRPLFTMGSHPHQGFIMFRCCCSGSSICSFQRFLMEENWGFICSIRHGLMMLKIGICHLQCKECQHQQHQVY